MGLLKRPLIRINCLLRTLPWRPQFQPWRPVGVCFEHFLPPEVSKLVCGTTGVILVISPQALWTGASMG